MNDSAGLDLKKTRRRKMAVADPLTIDRCPPHSLEAEQGVLGCILMSPYECLGEAIEKMTVDVEVFYDLRHQTLYQALLDLYSQRAPIDLITIQQWLKDRNQLEGTGGLAYIATLSDVVPSAANLNYYIDILDEKHTLRRMIQACTNAVSIAYEHEGEVKELVDTIERQILEIHHSKSKKMRVMRELIHENLNDMEKMLENKGAPTGIASGFPDLDRLTGGFQNSDLIILGARPSMGKTTLLVNWIEYVSVTSGLPTGLFSLEMKDKSLTMRMLAARARVNMRNISEGFMAERDFPKITSAAHKLVNAPIHIDDTSGLGILEFRAKARRMVQQHGVKLIGIDYIQLMKGTKKNANREQEISEISAGIKATAKELNIPIIALSQINRGVENRPDERPRLSDLRESGSLEQDADVVCLLYKDKSGRKEDDEDDRRQEAIPVKLDIAKQRNGPTEEIDLTFIRSYTRYESAAKIGSDTLL